MTAGNFPELIFTLITFFIVIALASKDLGKFFAKLRLPLITGFLFTGILCGPYVLGLLTVEDTKTLYFVDEVSLSVIALAAGAELYLDELRNRLRSICWVTIFIILATFLICGTGTFLLAEIIPFMQPMSTSAKIAISLVSAAILVARSPSSAIAVVNELRAKGPFTKTILGVTIVTDVAVIVLFAITSSLADSLLTDVGFKWKTIFVVTLEIAFSTGAGILLGLVISQALKRLTKDTLIAIAILGLGFGTFLFTTTIHEFLHSRYHFEFHLEPLLICMVASFWVTNFTEERDTLAKILEDIGPPIYVLFFTLTGASLSLDVLKDTWQIALILFGCRVVAIFIGAFIGGVAAKDPMSFNRISWMGYITQAGIGLGLAKQVSHNYPEWGQNFATIMISVIVLNQLIGPSLMKFAIMVANEAHKPKDHSTFDGVNDAVIFGETGEALALARQLSSHDWQVKVATRRGFEFDGDITEGVKIIEIDDICVKEFNKLDLSKAEAVVTLLSDEKNLTICEILYEHFGTDRVVVRLNERGNFENFKKLGALVVEPTTAMISLLDHSVRSPIATAVILDMDEEHDIIDIEVLDRELRGKALRDLRFPSDVTLLSIKRHGHTLISTNTTRLEIGDQVTFMGSPESLQKVSLRFSA